MSKMFFVDEKEYNVNDKIEISGTEHNHLAYVLRMAVGDEIICLANDGNEMICQIIEITKKYTIVRVKEIKKSITNPTRKVTLYVSLLKGEKFKFLITKLTELGIDRIVPFESEFMTAKKGNDKTEKFTQVARDACKQCHRSKLITIDNVITFDEMCKQIKNYDLSIFAYENEKTKAVKDLFNGSNYQNISVIIGSEGGFSLNEVNKLVDAGACIVTLGKRILRAETACLTLSSIVMYELGELK